MANKTVSNLKEVTTVSNLKEVTTVSNSDVLLVETSTETLKVTKGNLLKEVNEELNAKSDANHTHDEYVTESELNSKGLATEMFVTNKIAEAQLGNDGGNMDLSGYATTEYVDQEVGKTNAQLSQTKQELSSQLDNNTKKINPFYIAYELDNTGNTDVTSQLQQILNNNETVMLPAGIYQVSKVILNSNNYLYGENKDTTILRGNSSKYILETVNKAYNVKISKLTIDGNSIAGGVHFVATDNNDMTQFDIKNSITNVVITKSKFECILLDISCRECRITDVSCYYGEYGIIVNGTDNFISNCTVGAMECTGFSFYSNNKATFIKAFMCNKSDEGNAVVVKGYGVNISNLCVQQNYNNGLYVNGDNCYIDVVCDSQGYNGLYKKAFGIYVVGKYNNITGSVIDGRLNGSMKAGLYIDVEAFFNNINITFRVAETKAFSTTCDAYRFYMNKNLNNVTINGQTINSIDNIDFTYLKDYITLSNTSFLTDATGEYNINNNDIEISLTDFAALNSGYGSTLRTVIPSTNNKYFVLFTSVKYESNDNLNLVRPSLHQQMYNGGPTNNYLLYSKNNCTILNNFIDMFIVIDLDKTKTENNDYLSIWLALMKNTSDNQSSSSKAIFRNTRFYFTD